MEITQTVWRHAIKQAGGTDMVAAALGIQRRTLFLWRATVCPADRVADLARITGINACDLRPDLAAVFATCNKGES